MGKREQAPKLEIKYVGISEAFEMIYERNEKAHDIGTIIASIVRHGFRAPPIYDKTLGAIVAGNGRVEAVYTMYKTLEPAGAEPFEIGGNIIALDNPPEGIIITDKEWQVPIVYGLDSKSIQRAVGYLIDDNNLTIMGGDGVTALDASRSWKDLPSYLGLLEFALDQTETVDEEDYGLMLELVELGQTQEPLPPSDPSDGGEVTYTLAIYFPDRASRDVVENRFLELADMQGMTPAEFFEEMIDAS